MDYLVQPAALTSGTVCVPGDKSISHRALILGAVADGLTEVTGFLAGEDCLGTLSALQSLGVPVDHVDDSTVRVHGVGMNGLRKPKDALDLGNSGTSMRLFAGLLCGQRFDVTLSGDDSLTARPMQRVIEPLSLMGASIDSNCGRPPLVVHGEQRLVGIRYSLPVASAQVKSAILLAGLYAVGETTVIEPSITRDHTERMLRSMGADIECGNGRISIQGGRELHATAIDVPADLSSAAFLILGTLIARDAAVLIRGVGVNPTRTGAIRILKEMGGDISVENERLVGAEPVADIRVSSSVLHGIEVDSSLVSLAIDEFPVLFIAASLARGATTFNGIGELRVKESDRVSAMAEGLRLMGITVLESPHGAVIRGGELRGATVDSRGDHRVAMSFAIAATVAKSPVRVRMVDAVDTSFPGFPEVMSTLGGEISVVRTDEE